MTEANSQEPKKKLPSLGILSLFLVLGAGAVALVYSVSHWSAPAVAKRLKNPVPPTRANIGAGMEIYMLRCQGCHGENGDGKGERSEKLSVAPASFTDPRKMSETTDGELFWVISEGHLPMPAFKSKLTEEERWQVVDYIRAFAPVPSVPPSAPASH
jgi:mono/diheme cytochrome c family protein